MVKQGKVNPMGSSPRMRGTLQSLALKLFPEGIIPAHAGNTHEHPRPHSERRDHPRACGEHLGFYVNALASQGSSPRMRGTLVVPRPCGRAVGIIPAHAGNTYGALRKVTNSRDHPRACGEHTAFSQSMSLK